MYPLMVLMMARLRDNYFWESLGYTGGKVIVFDEGTTLISTDGKVLDTILGIVDGITLGLDVGTELGYLDR